METLLVCETQKSYRLLGEVGAGHHAEIYEAMEKSPGGIYRKVALKRARSDVAAHEAWVACSRKALLNEARILACLNHPHVLRLLSVEWTGTEAVLILEWLEGLDLRRVLMRLREAGQRFPIACAVRLMADACLGLAHLHDAAAAEGRALDPMHSEVRPDHLFVSTEGIIKLLDFGSGWSSHDVGLRGDGVGYGPGLISPGPARGYDTYGIAYLSPEQASGLRFSRASDIFDLGVVLHELARGEHPFRRENTAPIDTLERIRTTSYGDPGWPERLPTGLVEILHRAMAHEPRQRYATALELRDDLETLLAQEQWSCGPEEVADFLHRQADPRFLARRHAPRTSPPRV
jgi:serine/threonine-protein kinase